MTGASCCMQTKAAVLEKALKGFLCGEKKSSENC
uniref:Uncharacterized protein n=1 Tax=Anguilla anguilla TaxID=7936 RepID=A0A0E9QHX8_ANGAN